MNIRIKSFSFIEMLFTMLILTIAAHLLPLLIKQAVLFNSHDTSTQYIELELFARDITQSIVTSQHKLTIIHPQKFSIATSKNQTYSYSYKNGKVIKQVNDTGYIILLNNVLSFRVATIATHHLAIHLKLVEKGEYFEKTIYL